MNWKEYWKDESEAYLNALDGPYHRNRLAMVFALLGDFSAAGKTCVDFGCGDGLFARALLQQNARVVATDIDKTMVDAAKRLLTPEWPAVDIRHGGVEVLGELASSSADLLIALNVLAYFGLEDEQRFYSEAKRVVRPGGGLLVTHSNELFDLYTCNRYTAAFFARNFATGGSAPNISSLLAHPDKPARRVFGVRENPLAYRHKLKDFGFDEKRQEFAILHPLPPLLTPQINFDDINSRQYPKTTAWPERERWKLMFMCSIFGSYSIRS